MNNPESFPQPKKLVSRRTFVKGLIGIGVATMVGNDVSPDKKKDLELDKYFPSKITLENWVNERGIPSTELGVIDRMRFKWAMKDEYRARQLIADDLKQGVFYLERNQKLSSRAILESVNPSFDLIGAREASGGVIDFKYINHDSITNEEVNIELNKQSDNTGKQYYAARERRADGSLISEAKIYQDGSTELTLQFLGARYKDANPNLTDDPRFPKATTRTFNLLVNLLHAKGVI